MSPDEIAAILGPVDPVLIAEIAKTGATQEELAQAWIWINADEALINEGRPLPSGRTHCMIRASSSRPASRSATPPTSKS